MKRTIPLLLFVFCLSTVDAGYEYADRVISPGEYVWGLDWLSGILVVAGGGGTPIEVRNSGRIEVWSTSTPLGTGVGGIMDLLLVNNTRLDYYGGEMEELTVGQNATAYLHGGRIDGISSAQYASFKHIKIYAQEGWSWKYEAGKIRGITGLWYDNAPFNIRFTTHWESEGFHPAWMNVEVITPEPSTLLLFGLGGLLLRRRH